MSNYDLKVFINEPRTLAYLSHYARNGWPPAEAVGCELLRRFGNQVQNPQTKRYLGKLIRKSLEQQGFRHYQHNHKTSDPLFTKASIYI